MHDAQSGRQDDPNAHKYARGCLGRNLRRRVETDDVLQDAFLRAVAEGPGNGRLDVADDRGLLPWFKRLIWRCSLDLARRHVKAGCRTVLAEAEYDPEALHASESGAGRTPSQVLVMKERAAALHAVLERLTSRERELIDLVYFAGLKVGQAADRMGWSPESAAVLHSKTLQKIGLALERRGMDS